MYLAEFVFNVSDLLKERMLIQCITVCIMIQRVTMVHCHSASMHGESVIYNLFIEPERNSGKDIATKFILHMLLCQKFNYEVYLKNVKLIN